MRLGELTRTDDGVLGYFVDDDYSRFTPVSPEVLAQARAVGRLAGQLGVLGPAWPASADVVPVTHPVRRRQRDAAAVRPGQTRPADRAHGARRRRRTPPAASSPGEHLTVAGLDRPALKRLLPTFRVGPVLVDPAAVRVPKTTGLPKHQVFTAATGSRSWHDDPIAAATQDALLPTAPAVVREGYLRVTLPDTAAGSP